MGTSQLNVRRVARGGVLLFAAATGYVAARDLFDWYMIGVYRPRMIGDVAVEMFDVDWTSPILNTPAMPVFLLLALVCSWLAREQRQSLTDTFS